VLTSVIASEPPSTAYYAQYEDQQYRSDERNQDRLPVDPRHRTTDLEKVGSNPASQHSAKHSDDDVANQTIATSPHDLSGQETGDQTNDDPGK
jgi:hypothetical protein